MNRLGHDIVRWMVCGVVICGCAGMALGVEFAGGTGEPNDPYQIVTAEQLASIGSDANLLDKHFVLVNDIDLDPGLTGGRTFQQAVIAPDEEGTDANDLGFTGSFDGQGFKVRNLTIDARGLEAGPLGLFGRIGPGGCVRHLGIEKVAIYADEDSSGVGGLVGINSGNVEACYVSGSVSGGSKVGGLCGENLGIIQSCYSTVTVSGEEAVGGLVGCNSSTPNMRPTRPGSVYVRYSGGIAQCYSAGAVSGQRDVGGFVGLSVGRASGSGWSNFWDIDVSGLGVSGAGIGLTTSLMMEGAVFAAHGWDQDSNWVIEDGKDYPRLAWEQTNGQPIEAGVSDRFDGTGAAADPHWVGTAEQFALLGLVPALWDKHFVLEADLDLAGVRLYPIGWAEWEPYNGFFHGNGHVLRNVSMTAAGAENIGVFGAVGANGRISYLGLESVTITAGPKTLGTGTLAGRNDGVITGCYATGTIAGEQAPAVGGLAGVNMGRIAYSYAAVDVTDPISAGGLASGGTGSIVECYSAGAVKDADGKRDIVDGRCDLVFNSYFAAGPGDHDPDGIVRRPRPVPPSPPRTGWPLSDGEMRRQESFLGWDFAGSPSDGSVDRGFMPDANYPILSWQADLDGLRPIPDISALPLDWARAELELAGFVVGEFRYDYHSTIPKEAAILTSPVGLAPPGSTIDVVLSQGRYTPSQVSISLGWRSSYPPPIVEIETPGQVECLAGIMNEFPNFVLIRDIDMAGWEVLPLDTEQVLAGAFFGDDRKISNLKTYRGGFFNRISREGFVYGLRLANMVVADPDAASLGILAGVNEGTIMNAGVTGVVVGSEATLNLGGLVGENRGVIAECFAGATGRGRRPEPSDVEPDETLMPAHGGLAGMNAYAIVDCYATGDVSGTGYVGGLVGDNYLSISRCYAAVRVSGENLENTGGLAGHCESATRPTRPGPDTPPPVPDYYFLSPPSGNGPDNGIGIPLTDEKMRQEASFAGWDFENVWMICEGQDYPRLRWEGVECNE